jgi:hypothetical protein
LLGEWNSEPGADQGEGRCAFQFGLQERVLVRTNHATLAAGARAHDDLMVIYPGKTDDQAQAIYWDNEGHVIEYTAQWAADGNTLTFLSKPGAGPQFRLLYKLHGPDMLEVSFEIAPPGQPGAFKPYTSGRVKRVPKR